MEAQTVKAGEVEVYTNRIYMYEKEYIDELARNYNKDEIKSLMRKAPMFKGLLKYIYINIFKPDNNTKTYNNIKQNSNIDYGDIDLLNNLWDIYTGLCYRYLQCPTLLNFSVFTGIRHETLTDWTTGKSRNGGNEATSLHSQSAKKWRAECEAAAYDSALSGNPGAMFILKANYGYTETAPIPTANPYQIATRTPEEIAAGYGKLYENDTQLRLPDVPD